MSNTPDKFATLEKAFAYSANLDAGLLQPEWDKEQEAEMASTVRKLQRLMPEVIAMKDDITEEVVTGISQLMRVTKEKLKGKDINVDAEFGLAA